MAPSRGLYHVQHTSHRLIEGGRNMALARRAFTSFSEKVANPANRVQSYISRSNNPYLNLSIEDHILRTSPPDSAILFLYTNRPCVVIGRNQNPWLEVNLGILNAAKSGRAKDTEPPAIGNVDLVRRRSGGGTVFHDEGNVNWSITSPRAEFTRDKHAEMVVRALRKLGIARARVNERHDIVLDQGHVKRDCDSQDTHRTPYTIDDGAGPRPLKVSGSAYKLTRGRALHHGTTLLASPNLHIIPQYLHSPAKPFLKAKGVESFSSPVGNIGLRDEIFQKYLQEEFAAMYGAGGKQPTVEIVGEEYLNIPEIRRGYEELRTADWMFSQTPQFTLTNYPTNESASSNSHINQTLTTPVARFHMTIHHGVIKDCEIDGPQSSKDTHDRIRTQLLDRKLQDIQNWSDLLAHDGQAAHPEVTMIARWLAEIMPTPQLPKPDCIY
ncbi:hypothetical protein K469DRAFT_580006 [Zopfia rhizophila CBS 207.26]|uniref:Putative lipoate-protein ligase A n=1 Tax=Zopfia rhizophila CBS 207.26 TaxID=1314779 RepID=A0A6A6E1X1_9PEZI|nr:hypothetical protein K469DRAFT_580006 [Zopfia rhizophila CBS 207.26]